MKAEQQVFKIVFVENNVLQWTFEKFEDFIEAVYSEHGTSQKKIEINVFKAFLDAMESFFSEGQEICIQLFMKLQPEKWVVVIGYINPSSDEGDNFFNSRFTQLILMKPGLGTQNLNADILVLLSTPQATCDITK